MERWSPRGRIADPTFVEKCIFRPLLTDFSSTRAVLTAERANAGSCRPSRRPRSQCVAAGAFLRVCLWACRWTTSFSCRASHRTFAAPAPYYCAGAFRIVRGHRLFPAVPPPPRRIPPGPFFLQAVRDHRACHGFGSHASITERRLYWRSNSHWGTDATQRCKCPCVRSFCWRFVASPSPRAAKLRLRRTAIRYHYGDNFEWADPNFDDSGWPVAQNGLVPSRSGYTDRFLWVRIRVAVSGT